jgi:hypothetical protein
MTSFQTTPLKEQKDYFDPEKYELERKRAQEEHEENMLRASSFSGAAIHAALKGRDAEQQVVKLSQKIQGIGQEIVFAGNAIQLFKGLTENDKDLSEAYKLKAKEHEESHPQFHANYKELSEKGQEVKGLADAIGAGGADNRIETLASLKLKMGETRGHIFFSANDLITAAETLDIILANESFPHRLAEQYRNVRKDIIDSLTKLKNADEELKRLQNEQVRKQELKQAA